MLNNLFVCALVVLIRARNLYCFTHEAVVQDVIVVKDTGSGEDTAIPCTLNYIPETTDTRVYAFSLIWSRLKYDGSESDIYVYQDGEDGPTGEADTRFARTGGEDDPVRYYLTIDFFTEADEGMYCCRLIADDTDNTEASGCSDVYYKRFNKAEVEFDCHTGKNNTADIPICNSQPATISVEFTNIYPKTNPDGTTRTLTLSKVLTGVEKESDFPSASSEEFTDVGDNLFAISVNLNWTKAGDIHFIAALSFQHGIPDVKTFSCSYVKIVPEKGCSAECDPPCLNGGQCEEVGDRCQCVCPCGCGGKQCELLPPGGPCLYAPCVYGECIADCCGYVCECQVGYYGPSCNKDPCDPNPCMGSGWECIADFPPEHDCVCPENKTCTDEMTTEPTTTEAPRTLRKIKTKDAGSPGVQSATDATCTVFVPLLLASIYVSSWASLWRLTLNF